MKLQAYSDILIPSASCPIRLPPPPPPPPPPPIVYISYPYPATWFMNHSFVILSQRYDDYKML